MSKIDVLNGGFVRLVDHMGTDLSIVRAARVSFDADWRAGEDGSADEKLINYLWKNKHTSPFEAVQFTFEVKAPIFVFRQWHRHRTWSYNEVSARYTELDEGYYLPDVDKIGEQSKTNRQGRNLSATGFDFAWLRKYMHDSIETSIEDYKRLLESGVPRELARTVLPVACYSRMFASVNLLNLFRFLSLRNHEHAQLEIRVYAAAMLELIYDIVPVATHAFLFNS